MGEQKMDKYDHVTSNNCCSSKDIIKWAKKKKSQGVGSDMCNKCKDLSPINIFKK